MKRTVVLLLTTILVYAGCTKKVDQFDFQAGLADGAFFFSDIPVPETISKNYIHFDTNMVDLDNDLIPELNIVSLLDTTATDTLRRILKLTKNPDKNSDVFISLVSNNPPPAPVPYANGTQVKLNDQSLFLLNFEFNIARYFKDLTTEADSSDGIWNDIGQRSFIVKYSTNGQNYGSWVQINVTDHDQYTFYNYASFKVD